MGQTIVYWDWNDGHTVVVAVEQDWEPREQVTEPIDHYEKGFARVHKWEWEELGWKKLLASNATDCIGSKGDSPDGGVDDAAAVAVALALPAAAAADVVEENGDDGDDDGDADASRKANRNN